MELLTQIRPVGTSAEVLFRLPTAADPGTLITKIMLSKRVAGTVLYSLYHARDIVALADFSTAAVIAYNEVLTDAAPSRSLESPFLLKLAEEALGVAISVPGGVTISVYGVRDYSGPVVIGTGWSEPPAAEAISTAVPVEITDSTNAEGVGTALARATHQHAHGNRGGGALHATATGAVAGFLSAADKSILDTLAAGTRLFRRSRPFSGGSLVAVTPAVGMTPWTTPVAGHGLAYAEFPVGGIAYQYYLVESDPGWDGSALDIDVSLSSTNGLGVAAQVAKMNCAVRAVGDGDDYDVAFANAPVAADMEFVADKRKHVVTFTGVEPDGGPPAGGDTWIIRIGRLVTDNTLLGNVVLLTGRIRYWATLSDE